MRVMAWLKQFFSGRPARSENLSLEIDSIVDKFQIVKEAKRLAELGLPSFHEKTHAKRNRSGRAFEPDARRGSA